MNNFTKTLTLALVMLTLGGAKAFAEKRAWISRTGYSTLYYSLDEVNHTATVISAVEPVGDMKVPARITDSDNINYYVTTIGYEALKGNKSLKSLDLSSSYIETIQHDAFNDCSELQSVSLPSELKSIESQAFYNCKNLEKVTFATLKVDTLTIKESAFRYCGLTSLTLDDKVVNGRELVIDWSAFSSCRNLETVKVTGYIDTYAFGGCESLKEITFDAGTNYIGYGVVLNCKSLETVNYNTTKNTSACSSFANIGSENSTLVINAMPTSWKNETPFENSDFTKVILNCPTMPANTIAWCPSLKTFTVTDKVKSSTIANCKFRGCPNLEFESQNSTYKVVEGSIYNSNLSSLYAAAGTKRRVVLPSTVTMVFENAMDPSYNRILDVRATTKKGISILGNTPDVIFCTADMKDYYEKNIKGNNTNILVEEGKRGDLNNDNVVDGVDITTVVNIVNGGE